MDKIVASGDKIKKMEIKKKKDTQDNMISDEKLEHFNDTQKEAYQAIQNKNK